MAAIWADNIFKLIFFNENSQYQAHWCPAWLEELVYQHQWYMYWPSFTGMFRFQHQKVWMVDLTNQGQA